MNKNFLLRILSSYSKNIYRIAFIVTIIVLSCLLLFRIFLIFSYNGEIGGIDNNFAYAVLRAIKGYDLYPNPAEFPYAINLYSPLYYNICTGIGKLIHINADEPIYIYQLCRTVSLISDTITCGLLYLTIKNRFSLNKKLSLLAVAGFASILCFLGYTFSRCDSLFLAFYAATIYILISKPLLKNVAQILLLAFLSILCILSKQNGIIVPVLVIIWLLLHRAKKMAGYYFISFASFLTIAMLCYIYMFKHSYLFDNTIKALQNRIDLSWFYTDIFKRMLNSLWVLPLYISGIIAVKLWATSNLRKDKSLAAIFIIQTIFSLSTSLKWGSTAGYFNENFLLAFLIISRKMSDYKTEPQLTYIRKIIASLLPLFFLFFIHTGAQGYLFFIQKRKDKIIQYEQQKEIRSFLQPKLQGHYILNLSNPNTDFFKTLFYKEIAVPNFDMVYCCTFPDHTFDYSSLLKNMSNGKIAYLLMPQKATISEIWGISLKNYYKDTSLNGINIYKYKK